MGHGFQVDDVIEDIVGTHMLYKAVCIDSCDPDRPGAVYCIGVLYNEIAFNNIFGILVRIIIVDRPEGPDNYALGGCRCQPFTGSYAYSLA